MPQYLITHSLLSSWLYMLKGNPFEDATTERDPMAEFLQVLRREPTETTEAMQNGIDFENLVTDILAGHGDRSSRWWDAAAKIADELCGARLQYKCSTKLQIGDRAVVLYGRLDALKAGTIYDIKFSKSYERGKYFGSTQHPTYLRIIPEATEFVYLVSNGVDVWHEEYRRGEVFPIEPTIQNFFYWLEDAGLAGVYEQFWQAR